MALLVVAAPSHACFGACVRNSLRGRLGRCQWRREHQHGDNTRQSRGRIPVTRSSSSPSTSQVEKLAVLVRGRDKVTFTIVRLPFKVRSHRLASIAARTCMAFLISESTATALSAMFQMNVEDARWKEWCDEEEARRKVSDLFLSAANDRNPDSCCIKCYALPSPAGQAEELDEMQRLAREKLKQV